MDQDRRAFLGEGILHIRLTGNEPGSINCTRGDEANAFANGIHHGVTVVRHADALLIKRKADDGALAFFLSCNISIPPDEPWLVRFHIRTESAFGYAEIATVKFTRAESHFVTI